MMSFDCIMQINAHDCLFLFAEPSCGINKARGCGEKVGREGERTDSHAGQSERGDTGRDEQTTANTGQTAETEEHVGPEITRREFTVNFRGKEVGLMQEFWINLYLMQN